MKDVLEEIVAWKRVEVAGQKGELPEREIHRLAERLIYREQAEGRGVASMRRAIKESRTGIIAEFKRMSPSKGWIRQSGRATEIPLDYQHNGAAAVSILTDERYFGGHDDFIRDARRSGVTIPVLYKNFVIDEYQIFRARLCGASAILLIAAALRKDECRSLTATAHGLGLEVLLEMHGEEELEYAELEPDMCGINNRNLGSFVTDVSNSFRMARLLPADAVKVSESGISSPETICRLRAEGFHGFLIGENFMRAENPGTALKEFICTAQDIMQPADDTQTPHGHNDSL